MILQPYKQVIVSSGCLKYDSTLHAWNTIRLKREFVNEFQELKNRSFKTRYTALIFHSYELLEREIADIVHKKKPIPVLIYFQQEIDHET
jgi:hypothetical protein